jgi:hypothetical protein
VRLERQPVELMLNLTEREDCYGESSDQPILTFLVWSGRVKDAGIRYRFLGCDGGLMTLRWCVVNKVVRFNERVQGISPSNTVPACLHQYPRLGGLMGGLYLVCGMTA